MCQSLKNHIEALVEKLKLSEVLEKPWTYLIVDFIIKLLLIAEKNVILVVCNRLSKMTYFVVTTEEISTEELTQLFRDKMQKLYELPKSIVLNKRLQFVAELVKELNKMLKIETKLLISFHLQTDGQTEQMNQELEQYL